MNIVPSKVPTPYLIVDLPPLIIGGAVFNTQYAEDPSKLPIREILETGFSKGLIALDTSPYYGKSEELLGGALQQMTNWPRETYFICTKAGRVQLDEFDYSRALVRKSVLRSLERLHTLYLDLVYMHDIEFVKEVEIYDALRELRTLKEEGIIRNFGISGYPVDFLYHVALECNTTHKADIGPLDAILSYCNGCIQNTKLLDLYDDFFDKCGIQKLMNGSILSMSLLRSDVTHSFHPARQELKDIVAEVARTLKKRDQELADIATRFALKRWLFDTVGQNAGDLKWNKKTSIVLGVSSVTELMVAIDAYEGIRQSKEAESDEEIFREVKEMLGDFLDETWSSGIH